MRQEARALHLYGSLEGQDTESDRPEVRVPQNFFLQLRLFFEPLEHSVIQFRDMGR